MSAAQSPATDGPGFDRRPPIRQPPARQPPDPMADLTDAQMDAVTHVDGPMLTLAGPGSGKTRVVTHRIAHLLRCDVPDHQIVALTFTNKAAQEMRERLEHLVPGRRVFLGTFHRFCAGLLRRYASAVGLRENYSIYDVGDQKLAMKRALAEADVSTTHASPDQIATAISHAKNRLVTPEMMTSATTLQPIEKLASRVYPAYQKQLLRSNAVDFDDLLLHIATLLRENPSMRSKLDARFRYILVDEYQDTNLAQYAIVRALSIDHPNLAVTGDPDQSIYGWRGADLNNILDFEKDYPNVKVVRLEQNYRSTPNILRVADQLIRHNRHRKAKELFTENDEGPPVVLRMYEDGREEARTIVEDIARAVAAKEIRPGDVAIFCRMNALTRAVEQAMRMRSVPYQVLGGIEFYQRKEIKDLVGYLQLINNPSDDVALQRVINTPTRGIGDKTIRALRNHADRSGKTMLDAARESGLIADLPKRGAAMVARFVSMMDRLALFAAGPVEDLIRAIVGETKYDEYLQRTAVESEDDDATTNLDELIAGAAEFDRQHPDDGSLETYLEQVALVSATDGYDAASSRVTLMTLHAAKGLEFPWVYIIGVEDDLLPHARSKETAWQIEEERRLLFVGITRAERQLQMSYCKRRAIRGDLRPVIPSPFLQELPLEDIRQVNPPGGSGGYDECVDVEYPDEWSQEPDGASVPPGTVVEEAAGDLLYPVDQDRQWPPDDGPATPMITAPAKRPKKKASMASLKTAADLVTAGGSLLASYEEGMRVRHEEYGIGTIVSIAGRGMKRMARVQFEDDVMSFRLAHTTLEVVP